MEFGYYREGVGVDGVGFSRVGVGGFSVQVTIVAYSYKQL